MKKATNVKLMSWEVTVFGCPKKGSYHMHVVALNECSAQQCLRTIRKDGGSPCLHCDYKTRHPRVSELRRLV